MLVTFNCPTYGKLTYFEAVARRLLQLSGHSATIPGAFSAEEVPQALTTLVDALEHQPQGAESEVQASNSDEATIHLAVRAAPLIKMLEAAVKHHEPVLWQ